MKAKRVRQTEVGLTVYNEQDAWLESVDIPTTMPLGYAKLLIEGEDKWADALQKDLKQFLASKWKMLKPIVERRPR